MLGHGFDPCPTQWIKDQVLPQLHFAHDYGGSDLIPSPGIQYAAGWPKMKKKKKKESEKLK